MNRRIVSLPQIRVSPATSDADWRDGAVMVSELLEWLTGELRLKPTRAAVETSIELDDLAGYYAFPSGLFLIGRVEGEAAGTAGIRFLDDETAELKRVWVRPAYRGSGLAQALLARALDGARALGATRVVLETEPRIMAKALNLYRQNGFRERDGYSPLSQSVPTVLTMQKRVA
ncbi:MAG: GNAT family N-acetyltransferase [bacterium]